ncbi:MAG: hypothetical protein Q8922_10720 [Bacteroidota bacterium]|nr:hypothetical protein [Bacteroidota bacterium]MDP4233693.1 hypothetical protein [Bacteroidota bacterium]MDP4241850.1 hypothetical protein [Bacteroidota bacterium]MDP4288399.1 hypothetical protein [Bacteroidota bacterium]
MNIYLRSSLLGACVLLVSLPALRISGQTLPGTAVVSPKPVLPEQRIGTEVRTDVPHLISYQGLLRAASGLSVSDGEYTITARLYSDATGSHEVWHGTYTVKTQNGVFNISLGSGESPLPPPAKLNVPLWIGIQVGETTESLPLAPLSASPYSLNVADSSITSQKISTDYVKSISVNGERISGTARDVNIVTGDGLLATVDPATSSILLKSQGVVPTTQKGAATQGNTVVSGTLTVTQATYLNTTSGETYLGSNSGGVRGVLNLAPGSGTNYTAIQAPSSMSSTVIYTLPASQGSSGTVLTNNGSGTLSWTAGGVTGSGTAGTIPVWTGGTSQGNSHLTDDGTTLNYYSGLFTVDGSAGSIALAGSLSSTGDATIATGPFTTNTFGNDGNAVNSIGNGSSTSNAFGSGGFGTTNEIGLYADDNWIGSQATRNFIGQGAGRNDIGNTGGEINAIGAASSTNYIRGTIHINDSTAMPTYIGTAGSGIVNIGNTTGGTTIEGATHINDATAATTNIGTGGTGIVNIGNTSGGTTITGQVILAGLFPGTPAKYLALNASNQVVLASGGGITGSGVANQVAYWNGTTSETGNSNFTWDNTNQLLSVGNGYQIGASTVLADPGTQNIFIGVGAGVSNTAGNENMFSGVDAGHSNTSGEQNTFSGFQAGYGNTSGSDNTFLGIYAGFPNTTGYNNTYAGALAGFANTTGINNAFFGEEAGFANTTGFYNTFLGQGAGFSETSGSGNVFSGVDAGFSTTTGTQNTFTGMQAGYANTTGQFNTFTGFNDGLNTTGVDNSFFGALAGGTNSSGHDNTIMGYNADVGSAGLSNATAIGAGAVVANSNTIQLGNGSVTKVNTSGAIQFSGALMPNASAGTTGQVLTSQGPGTPPIWAPGGGGITGSGTANQITYWNGTSSETGSANFTLDTTNELLNVGSGDNIRSGYQINGSTVLADRPNYDIFVGVGAGTSNTTGANNTFLGYLSGTTNADGSNNSFSGYEAGYSNTSGYENTFLGSRAGYSNTTGYDNVFTGHWTGLSNTTGFNNTFSGDHAGAGNTTGNYNTFSGQLSGTANSTGSYNTFTGSQTGEGNSSGALNTFTGYQAGYSNTTGNNNTFEGGAVGYYNTTGSYNIYIGLTTGYNSSTGSDNTFVGSSSGITNTTGGHLTLLGYSSDVASSGLTNATAIGNGAVVAASNTIQLGNASVTLVNTHGSLQFAGALMPNDSAGTTGQVLTSQGPGAPPVWTSGGGGITGSGAANQVAYWNGASSETGDANFTWDGTHELLNVGNSGLGGYQIYGSTILSSPWGWYNIALGADAGVHNTSGAQNTFLGGGAGNQNTTGHDNMFSGSYAGTSNTSGYSNTFSGPYAGESNTTGNSNTFSGLESGLYNTTGSNNTFVGEYAGSSNYGAVRNTTESNNTLLGASAQIGLAGITNATAIGYGAVVDTTDEIQLGNGYMKLVNTSGAFQFSGALKPGGSAGTNNQVLTSTGASSAPVWQNATALLGSGPLVVSYASVASGSSLTGSSGSPYGYAVVDVQDDGTSAPATLTLPTGAPNGQVLMVTTEDVQGLMITSSAISLIYPTQSERFIWTGGGSGSWKRETP